jgi:hypothetical protein
MSEEAQNVAILKEAYRLWHETKGRSVDHWIAICADAIQFGSLAQNLGSVPYMTTYEDVRSLARYFAGLAQDWDMIEFRTENFVAQGDRVVMLAREEDRHCGLDAEGGLIPHEERQDHRILRIFRHRAGTRRDAGLVETFTHER